MKVSAIIQVRMGSTRLPGKVLRKLNGISLLECLFSQLSYSKLLDDRIIATTNKPEDGVIVEFAKSRKIKCFRGHATDVLDRYYQCAKNLSIEHIVRITSDNPLIDPSIVDRVVDFYKKNDYDYVNNFHVRTYPYGTEVEVFSYGTLERTWQNAKKNSEREHVTPYIYNNPNKFSITHVENNNNLSKFHWTVDKENDLKFVTVLFKRIKKRPILMDDILEVLQNDPSLLKINENTNPNEGYVKSLKDDEG